MRTRRRLVLAWLARLAVAGVFFGGQVAPSGAQSPTASPLVEQAGAGSINWTTGWVKASGIGAPPPNVGPGQARAMAQRAAFTVAVRNLLETVKGVRIDSQSLVENYFVQSDAIRAQVSGFVRGAQIDKTEAQPDGAVEVTVKVPLWGADSLITTFMGEKAVRSLDLPPESESESGHTGLIIDARGLGVKPACFPSILDEKGTVLYGPETVDRSAAQNNGLAEYHALPAHTNLSSFYGERAYIIRPVQVAAVPREGRRPLKIKGINKAGSLKANILISTADAKRIQEDTQIGGALKRSKVVIVTDPLIGGILGRAPSFDGLTAFAAAPLH